MDVVYRHAAIADGTGPTPVLEQSVVVADSTITWMGHDDECPEPVEGARVIDAGGASIVPGMVDAHSHTVLPGGSHWIARIDDSTGELRRVAEDNGDLAHRTGIRWLRDVGSPRRDGRALALHVRDAWSGRADRPHIRAAGTWISQAGALPPSVAVEAADADDLVDQVIRQIEDGADLVKLYLDGPDPDTSPWTADEVARAVEAASDRDRPVTAHSTRLAGARAAVFGGVDCIEHGMTLDRDLAAEMARRETFLVPTLAIWESWASFGSTTTLDRFSGDDAADRIAEGREGARASTRLAIDAGVRIAAGTDFGGGSLRANQLAWEVIALVEAGLEPWRALAAATWIGGDLLREQTAGRMSVGGPADFFLVHGNPLEDPSCLWRVWRVS